MPKIGGEPIDVVVPVRSAEGSEYGKLLTCCQAIRRRVPVNRLIMPSANASLKTRRRISELADIPLFDEAAIGAGLCRNLGLKEVETEFYASIDADTAIRQEWYPWCAKTLHEPKVAACQGYSKPLSRLLDKFVRIESLNPGHYADLGNTMLRTDVVKEVGMPKESTLEDHLLHDRITRQGYAWIVNQDLYSDHLVSELDVLRHRYWYGKFDPQGWLGFCKNGIWLSRESIFRRHRYGTELALFLMLADLSFSVGSLIGRYAPPT